MMLNWDNLIDVQHTVISLMEEEETFKIFNKNIKC